MEINVTVSDITLGTIVAEVFGYDSETGEPYQEGSKTVADLVAEQIVHKIMTSPDYRGMQERVREIRAEVIREAVRPQVDEAIAMPIRKTNTWGEAIGEATTLREVIIDEARKLMNEPVDRYAQGKGTYLTKAVRDEVKAALSAEITEAVKQVREQVAGQAGQLITDAVTAAMKAR